MPKMHELLAIERNLKSQADKVRNELIGTFKNKTHHFGEARKIYTASEEGSTPIVESQLDLQTTVSKELAWISPFLAKALDVSYSVAEANTVARADVILDNGTVLLQNVPATALLELEKRAAELFEFVVAIPTLDPAKGFKPDDDRGAGIFRARDVSTARTKKVLRVLTLAAATDKHPAQAKEYTEDVPIGTITTMEWSGLITTAAKGEMIARVEDFSRAVKQARSRANETEIPKNQTKIGTTILDFVFGG